MRTRLVRDMSKATAIIFFSVFTENANCRSEMNIHDMGTKVDAMSAARFSVHVNGQYKELTMP